MIRLRHIAHPIRSTRSLYYSTKSLYYEFNLYLYRRLAERYSRTIRRSRQDRCWCGGELLPFKWHASYSVCANCGCYVNQHPPLPEELKRIYSFEAYWHIRQKMRGYPTIEHRPVNDRSDGRVDYWLGLIERYGPSKGRVIEIGCAHGVLLAELKSRGYECIGVEPDERTANWAIKNMGLDVRSGLFPGIDLPNCDLFLAFDVLEHSLNPVAFMKSAAKLLNPGGIAIIQVPIECYDYDHPFKARPDFFDDLEHIFLFTDKAMLKLAALADLEVINLENGLNTLGQICVLRRI